MSNEEMRRLVVHAADQLAAALLDLRDRAGITTTVAAVTMAEQTLRMVAAFLADDEPARPHIQQRAVELMREYAEVLLRGDPALDVADALRRHADAIEAGDEVQP